MILKIALALAGLLAVLAIVVACRPSHFEIRRSLSIAASPAAIFPHVNAARAWEPWSPWTRLDPDMKVTYEGPASGVGAATAFAGRKAGAGRSTIVESRPNELVRFRLEMAKPFAASNEVVFTFTPDRVGTTVTWRMAGENNFVMKAVGLFMNCDDMVGREFEHGLANLKAVVERPAAALATVATH